MDKKTQRNRLSKIRNSLTVAERTDKSREIIRRLRDCEPYRSAKVVLTYVSFGSEVETREFLQRIIADGKTAAVPVCDTKTCEIKAYAVRDAGDLGAGAYGILEPEPEKIRTGVVPPVGKSEIDLVVLPGLGFDRSGYRLGYGKGYYDRFLDGFGGCSAGLCFDCCVADRICRDGHDLPADYVITETSVIKATR